MRVKRETQGGQVVVLPRTRVKPFDKYNKSETEGEVLLKVLLIGDSCVGKTTFVRLVSDSLKLQTERTRAEDWITIDSGTQISEPGILGKNYRLLVRLVDIQGEETANALTSIVARDNALIVGIIDFANPFPSLDRLKTMFDVARMHSPKSAVYIYANKLDLNPDNATLHRMQQLSNMLIREKGINKRCYFYKSCAFNPPPPENASKEDAVAWRNRVNAMRAELKDDILCGLRAFAANYTNSE